MATLEIELPPQEHARLNAEAEREGLPLADWARQRLTGSGPTLEQSLRSAREAVFDPTAKPLWEIMAELDAIEVPSVMAKPKTASRSTAANPAARAAGTSPAAMLTTASSRLRFGPPITNAAPCGACAASSALAAKLSRQT